MAQHVTFRIRAKYSIPGLCLYAKKKDGEITRQEVADVVGERLDRTDIWAADIEDLTPVAEPEEVQKMFDQIENENKFYS